LNIHNLNIYILFKIFFYIGSGCWQLSSKSKKKKEKAKKSTATNVSEDVNFQPGGSHTEEFNFQPGGSHTEEFNFQPGGSHTEEFNFQPEGSHTEEFNFQNQTESLYTGKIFKFSYLVNLLASLL